MSTALSSWLHLIRFAAALVVVAHHASYERFNGAWLAPLAGFGHEAVVVFFVLSGYVITFSADTREPTLQRYLANRLSRLLSVAIPALILTYLFDAAGTRMQPQLYAGLQLDGIAGYAAAVAFINESWFLALTPGSNIPFWSLSYEFLYYMIFAAAVFFPRNRLPLVLCLCVAGPKVLLLLPAWLAGSAVWRLSHHPLTRSLALLCAMAGAGATVLLAVSKLGNKYITWRWEGVLGPQWFEAMGHAQAFVSDNLMAVCFAIHLLGMARLLRDVHVPGLASTAVRRIADTTFCLYLIHYPALYFFTALTTAVTGEAHGLTITLASIGFAMLMTTLTEALRRALKTRFMPWPAQSFREHSPGSATK